MIDMLQLISASFTAPIQIGTNPQAMLWLLPLAAAIAVVYKATKLPEIKTVTFLKESIILFGSIVVFIAIAAIVLWTITHLVT
ncbi:hypothetical protein ACFL3G_05290 [Planctomycetota bacterium]